jgi:hypothetical protein
LIVAIAFPSVEGEKWTDTEQLCPGPNTEQLLLLKKADDPETVSPWNVADGRPRLPGLTIFTTLVFVFPFETLPKFSLRADTLKSTGTGVGVGVAVGVAVRVAVGIEVGVLVGVEVAVGEGVSVGDGVGDAVGVGGGATAPR